MRQPSKPIVLICEECGEKTLLEGPNAVWSSEPTVFECGCGKGLTLADQANEEACAASRVS